MLRLASFLVFVVCDLLLCPLQSGCDSLASLSTELYDALHMSYMVS